MQFSKTNELTKSRQIDRRFAVWEPYYTMDFYWRCLVLLMPFSYQVWRLINSDLGPEPSETLNKAFGEVTLQLVVANLLIGCLFWHKPTARFFAKWKLSSHLQKWRRPLGVMATFYLIFHVCFYFLKEGEFAPAFEQVLTKNYLRFGALASFIVLVLGFTSNQYSVRKLGRRWKWLHRWIYLGFAFMALHYFLIEKSNPVEWALYFLPLGAALLARGAYSVRMNRAKA